MASKGQIFNRYDPGFRETVLKEYFEGHNGGAKFLGKEIRDLSYPCPEREVL